MGIPSQPGNATPPANSLPVSRASEAPGTNPQENAYGLRRAALSPMETLAQSVSTVAPTLTPVATIPLVIALSGNGTWLAYVLATVAILFVAWCIGRFARYTSSPGSLYSYATMILPPWLGATAAWSLLFAYVCTAANSIGGFYAFGGPLFHQATGSNVSPVLLCTLITVIPIWIAWRDVQISARLMLSMEAVSVALIVVVVALVLLRHGLHGDAPQFRLQGMTGSGLRLGVVLAVFSFAGFESATTLGAEAREPLKTIPRAVMLTPILGGVFFTICAYAELLGLHLSGSDLATTNMPMHVLANVVHVPAFALLIDLGALVTLFAGVLGCITAAARVLLLMSHNGLIHGALRTTHERNETPGGAILFSGLAALIPVAILAGSGVSGLDVYGWTGSLATYGFIVTYGLVCFALPRYLRKHHGVVNAATRIIPWVGVLAMVLGLIANLYPVPEGPYGKLPYIYLAYLAAVLLWFAARSGSRAAKRERDRA